MDVTLVVSLQLAAAAMAASVWAVVAWLRPVAAAMVVAAVAAQPENAAAVVVAEDSSVDELAQQLLPQVFVVWAVD